MTPRWKSCLTSERAQLLDADCLLLPASRAKMFRLKKSQMKNLARKKANLRKKKNSKVLLNKYPNPFNKVIVPRKMKT